MRPVNFILLIAIFVSIVTPFLPDISYSPDKGMSIMFTLDVCGASNPSLSVNADMPALYECPCKHTPLAFIGFFEVQDPTFKPFLISFRLEQPPRV
jgi:hypothetical protein